MDRYNTTSSYGIKNAAYNDSERYTVFCKTFQNFCILFIWTLSIVQFNKIHNVSETGSVSVFR